MTPAETEKIKARANLFNSMASSSIVTATVTPLVGIVIGIIPFAAPTLFAVLGLIVFWFGAAYLLHSLAMRQLDQLE